jgi:hypothetical protein
MPDGSAGLAPYEMAGASLLARQPTALAQDDTGPGKNWDVIFNNEEKQLSELRNWRYSWWTHWASLAEYILPRQYKWLVTANTYNRGLSLNQRIVDSTATLAMQTCAAGMWSGLTPPTRPWFKLASGIDGIEMPTDAKEWLENAERMIYYVFANSNFYSIMAQAFQDVATFGTAPAIMYEDFDSVIRCYLPCAGEYFLDVGSRFDVDTFKREFTLNVKQIVDMFTLENCPLVVRKLWKEGNITREFTVAHSIRPNFAISDLSGDATKIRIVPGSFTYCELYWLKGQKTERELSRRGFHEKPFFVARWSTVSNDAYGRSPGMDALGDIKQLQLETIRKAEYLEKGVRPPMGAGPEMKNEPASINPGRITYTRSDGKKEGFWPLFEVSPAWVSPITEDITKVQERIKECFFVNLFMAITNMQGVQPRNELELTKRDLERLQALGPFVNLFESETAAPAVMRALNIIMRRRLLPPMPASVRAMPLKVECISMMKIAQAASENTGIAGIIAQAIQFDQAALQTGAPPPSDVFDLDESLRTMAENGLVRSKIMRSTAEVEKIRAMRQKAQQGAAAAQIAPAAVTAAKTLSETDPQSGALGAMLGSR